MSRRPCALGRGPNRGRGLRKSRTGRSQLLTTLLTMTTLVCCAWGLGAWTSGGRLPSSAPERTDASSVERNSACVRCHELEAAQWRTSRHRQSFVNQEFERAFAVEPLAFCRDCHAPESASVRSDSADDIGVACVTCHLAGESVLAAPKPFFSSGLAPHRLERRSDFAASGACRSCHEFSFGDDSRRRTPLLMQSTVSEHAASGETRSCADCHMPAGSHLFGATRDPAAHQAAIRARAERTGPTTLRITLESNGVGHSYPTGDLFRRVRVSAEAVVDEFRLVSQDEAFLQRRFGTGLDERNASIREQVDDNRIRPGSPSFIDLELGSQAHNARMDWRVELERVLHVGDGQEARAMLADSTLIARGTLPAPTDPPATR